MPHTIPHLDIVTSVNRPVPTPPWYRSARVLLFVSVFGITLGLGQLFNFMRPAVYRSSATVLTVAPPKVDESAPAEGPDVQHVAIQRQLLLGQPLLRETLQHLERSGELQRIGDTTVEEIRGLLAVLPVTSTHMVELRAEGPRRDLLAPLINAWIEAYVAFREQSVQQELGDTLTALQAQYAELGKHLTAKRKALEAFRERHEIISQGRTENWAHARLEGLNKAINRAQGREAEAAAGLRALREAVERGEEVVPDAEKRALSALHVEAAKLRKKLAGYDKRFKRSYMRVDPHYQALPDRLAEVEQEIGQRIEQGQRQLLTDARNDALAARETVRELEKELETHKQEAAEFTARFTEYEGMVRELEGLEELYRNTEQRLARIESERLEKYPQVKVVDWAYPPVEPLYPHYSRDAMLILAAALVLALLAVWLRDYLSRPPAGAAEPGGLAGIRVYSGAPALENRPPVVESLPGEQPAALGAPAARELTEPELEALWRTADQTGRQLLALLLSGLSLEEAAQLRPGAFDGQTGEMETTGIGARRIRLGAAAHPLFREPDATPLRLSGEEAAATPADLEAHLKLLAYDSGLPYPEQVDAGCLRHTYLLFLIRQGARLRELERIIGPVPTRELTALAPYSPAGPGRPLEEVEQVHPVLRQAKEVLSKLVS